MKRRISAIFMALAMCVSLLPTAALAEGAEDGSSIVTDGNSNDGKEPKNEDDKAHECVFVDGRCECGKEEPAAPPMAQPLGAYALRTAGDDPEGGAAAQALTAVSYIGADGKTHDCNAYTELKTDVLGEYKIENDGWYVVSENVKIDGMLKIAKNAAAHLILCDGKTLTVTGGVYGEDNAELHIYGQSEGSGRMEVSGEVSVNDKNGAAIRMSNALVVNGGVVTAKLESSTSGKKKIGVYTHDLTVNGGELHATGGKSVLAENETTEEQNCGINAREDVTLNGGKLYATGGAIRANVADNADGKKKIIGSSGIKIIGNLTLNGGEMYATGGMVDVDMNGKESIAYSHGIFVECVKENTVGDICMNGGTLHAVSGAMDVDLIGTDPDGFHDVQSYGIYVDHYYNKAEDTMFAGVFALADGTLHAESGAVDLRASGDGEFCGYSAGICQSGGMVEMTGGTLDAEGDRVYSTGFGESNGIYAGVGVSAKGGSKLTATGGNCIGYYESESYGISGYETLIEGEETALKAKSGNASLIGGAEGAGSASYALDQYWLGITDATVTATRGEAMESYDISGGVEAYNAVIQSDGSGAAVRVWANLEDYSVDISGGAMKLAEGSELHMLTVSDGMTLQSLLDSGCVYQKIADGSIVVLGGETELEDVIVKRAASGGSHSSRANKPKTPAVSTYSVSSAAAANGALTVSTENAKKGDIVTITVNPESGYTLETLQILDENGNEIALTDNGDGTYSFEMPAGEVEVKHSFAEDNSILNFFADVPTDAYFYDAALWAAKKGITGGIDENNFGPDLSCTRAQLVTFLWRAANKPAADYALDFTDVDADAYYGEAIRWAASLGIVSGYGNGLFGTGDTITREQMAVILYRFAQAMGLDTTQGGMAIREFADYENISGYALEAMQWAVNAGILHGDQNTLMPDQPCSRAQIVAMLYRMPRQA